MPIGSLSGPALASVLGRPGQWWPSNPRATCGGHDHDEEQRQLHNRRHLLPRKRPGRTRKTWGGDGRGSGGGEEGVGCLTDGARAVATAEWAGLALPVAVTPGFPPGAGETPSTVPHRPAGHQAAWLEPGLRVRGFEVQPWNGKASLLTCPVSPRLGSSSR